MFFSARILAILCLLLCQACSHLAQPAAGPQAQASTHEYHFDDGGKAFYFVLDRGVSEGRELAGGQSEFPDTFLFVIPGSDCTSMRDMLPHYFDGLDGLGGAIRIFILHKRFIPVEGSRHCSAAFTQADHPSRWLADQAEFIRSELSAAFRNAQAPKRVVIAGISEGAEIAPILVRLVPGITHLAILGNGGMDPFDAYRLQAKRHGFGEAPDEILRACTAEGATAGLDIAERTCGYWLELRGIRHTDNLLALDIPIFMAMGEADAMVPVESALFIRERFAAMGRRNLELHLFPETGHEFRRHGKTVLPYLWEAFDYWLKK